MKVLITGSSGQLGVCLNEVAREYNYDLKTFSHANLDISDFSSVERTLLQERPNYVINAAAFTNVPSAEKELVAALNVNAYGAINLAIVAEQIGAKLIQVSTNFVFAGDQKMLLDIEDLASPVNFYGRSKLLGEQGVSLFNFSNSYIVRTSALYSEFGNNFFLKIMKKLNDSDWSIPVISDQFCQPTYARDLAEQILNLIKFKKSPGKYHFVNEGIATWFDFAKEIAKLSGHSTDRIVPVSASDFNDGVIRPSSALLKPTQLEFQEPLRRNWSLALADCLRRVKE